MDSKLLDFIKDILSIVVTPIILAWIALLQVRANKKQNEIGVKVDGMTSKLVEAEKGKSAAEGKLDGLAQAKADMVIPLIPVQAIPATDIKVSLKEEVVKKVAETVVETVKSDPDIEVKKKID